MYLHNIDLHYHAGNEREEGVTLYDHIEHARQTGRLILGLTDHYGSYINPSKKKRYRPYQQTLQGLFDYKAEIDSLKSEFPTMKLLFCPELGPKNHYTTVPQEVIDASDFFIFETAFLGTDIKENTDSFVSRIIEVNEFRKATGKQGYIAHPFRKPSDLRLVDNDIEPWVTDIPPSPTRSYPIEEINQFFCLDIDEIGQAASHYDIPLEVNGATNERIRALNLPGPLHLLEAAYIQLHKYGNKFVHGSDQHGYWLHFGRGGKYIPCNIFELLNISVEDIEFIQKFI